MTIDNDLLNMLSKKAADTDVNFSGPSKEQREKDEQKKQDPDNDKGGVDDNASKAAPGGGDEKNDNPFAAKKDDGQPQDQPPENNQAPAQNGDTSNAVVQPADPGVQQAEQVVVQQMQAQITPDVLQAAMQGDTNAILGIAEAGAKIIAGTGIEQNAQSIVNNGGQAAAPAEGQPPAPGQGQPPAEGQPPAQQPPAEQPPANAQQGGVPQGAQTGGLAAGGQVPFSGSPNPDEPNGPMINNPREGVDGNYTNPVPQAAGLNNQTQTPPMAQNDMNPPVTAEQQIAQREIPASPNPQIGMTGMQNAGQTIPPGPKSAVPIQGEGDGLVQSATTDPNAIEQAKAGLMAVLQTLGG